MPPDTAQPGPTIHECFRSPSGDEFTPSELRELRVKQTALLIAAGLEPRSMRALAADIGCSHQAIDKAVLVLCRRIGIRKFRTSDEARGRMREARARQLGTPGDNPAPQAQPPLD